MRNGSADAISAAESKTSGEIVAVIAPESGSYLHVPILLAALAALAVPWPFVFWTWWPIQHIYVVQLVVFAGLAAAVHAATAAACAGAGLRQDASARIVARSSSSWRRTCTPCRAARAC